MESSCDAKYSPKQILTLREALRSTANARCHRSPGGPFAQGLDPLKLRSSPKLGYGMVIDSKRLQVMEECVRRAGAGDGADRSAASEVLWFVGALLNVRRRNASTGHFFHFDDTRRF